MNFAQLTSGVYKSGPSLLRSSSGRKKLDLLVVNDG